MIQFASDILARVGAGPSGLPWRAEGRLAGGRLAGGWFDGIGSRFWSWIVAGMLLMGGMAFQPPVAQAQEAWEYSPYRIRVWLAMDHSPLWTTRRVAELEQTLRHQLRTYAGATWRLHFERSPEMVRTLLLGSLHGLTYDQMLEADESLREDDKLMVVSLRNEATRIVVEARELDISTRVWSQVEQREVRQSDLLGLTVAQAMRATFAPLARIEDVRGNTAFVRLRAAGLSVDEHCPSSRRVGDVMKVVMRRNDRYGHPLPDGIRTVEWTLLQVAEVDGARLECDIHSINRNLLGGRSSSRVARFALGIRTPDDRTEIQLLSRTDPPTPLIGYEIHARDPQTEASEFVGQTDWRGIVEVTRDASPLKVYYVRSGGMLLARLPLVPGQMERASVQLMDDEKRLQAEALVRGVQATLVDVVARRELLAARIRQKISESEFEEAQELVDEFRSIQTLADLRSRLDRAKQEVTTNNPRLQARIDQLFAETQTQLSNFIRPNLVEELTAELAKAQSP